MVYVVDDAADYRFLVQQVFKRFLPQYSFRLFADGLELIQSIESGSNSPLVDRTRSDSMTNDLTKPGLIVLDVDMPKLNGFQTLERLKQYPSWQTVPVVMISSRLENKFFETAHKLGANSYLLKPMDLTELQDVMTQLCHQWIDP